jgi:crossover junction endodeoxyribonuclease RuvC
MLTIGIDPGTATTGFGLVSDEADGRLVAVDYGVILTPAGMPMPERLLILHHRLQELLQKYHPVRGAVEKIFFQRNVTTVISVSQARGVSILSLAEIHIPVLEYTPLEVKQAVTGYGKAEKKQVQEMVRMILHLDEIPRPDDAADALAVAICCHHSSQLTDLLAES